MKKEKKEKDKQKKKDKIARQKEEGTYLTAKEKEARRRAQLSLEAMKAQGLVIPAADATAEAPAEEKKPKRPIYDNRKKKKQAAQRQTSVEVEGERAFRNIIVICDKRCKILGRIQGLWCLKII